MGLLKQLEAIINLLLIAHPQGLRVLLGQCAPPDAREISEMLGAMSGAPDSGVRGGGSSTPEAERIVTTADMFEAIITAAGGWEHVNRVCQEWAAFYPKVWGIVVSHTAQVASEFARLDDSQLDRLSRRFGVSRDTVCRYRRDFPRELARAILAVPVDGVLWFVD